MSVARILVPAFGTPRDEVSLATAIATAKLFGSHVQVLAVHPYPADAIPNVGAPLTLEAMQSILDGQVSCARAMDAALRAMIGSICTRDGATVAPSQRHESGAATCSFRAVYGDLDQVTMKSASLSDLVVMSPGASSRISGVFLRILRDTQRPVLVAKQAPRERLRNIFVGWDGSGSAARAIRQSMPFLQRAKQVSIVSVVRPGHAEPPTEALSDYLTRHEARFQCRKLFPGPSSAADALLNEAERSDADLVVAGGYGHDQLWEALFGGATASLLADSVMPVLLVH